MKKYENYTREELINEIKALKKAVNDQKKFSVLFDSSPEAIIFTSGSGKFIECNNSASVLFGHTKNELTGLSFGDIATDDIADKLPAIFREELSNDGIIYTGTFKKKNGDVFPAELLTKLITINGKTFRWAIFHDLSGLCESESENVISDEKIRDLVLLLPELIGDPEIVVETDKSGKIISANKIFFNKTGYSENDIKNGLEFDHFIQSKIKEDSQTAFHKFLTGESLDVNEYSAVKKDGFTFPVIIYATKIESESNSGRLRIFALDITDHKHFEKNLINMEKFHALGEISGGVLHNINNVLAIILGYIEISSKKIYKDKQCKVCLDILDKIKIAALDGSEIVKRIYNITQIKTDVEKDTVRINDLVEEAVEYYRPHLDNKACENGIQITVTKDLSAIPDILGSNAEIREILNNIIKNAIEAMPTGGNLSFSTNIEHDTVMIKISDTGIGLSDEAKSKIFKPFYTTKGKNGTGLGMHVSQEMIHKLGGEIVVESELSKGTSFIIYLPSSKDKNARETIPTGESKNILVIDDEKNICELFIDYFTMDGHTVTAIQDGVQALSIFDPKQHDIVITDLNMPKISGLDIVSHIKKKSPKTTVILITGSPASMKKIKKENKLVNYVLPKPINFKELSRIIDLIPLSESS
ncbi:PAS domain S-box protein [Candidatus Latescibacterota bacterium]